MKNHLNKALIALTLLGTASQVNAWSYTFSNHTNKEIGVAMRYYGLGEPRYFRWVPAHQGRQFTPGKWPVPQLPSEGYIDPSHVGFVAKEFWYAENPTPAQKATREAALQIPWRSIGITWISSSSYEKIIDLAEAVGKTTEGAGKLALEAGAAYATGGASVAASGAAEAAGAASKAVQGSSTTADVLKSAGGNVGDLGLANLVKQATKVASESMATDRHIDIIEDEKGNISFISRL